MGDSQVDFAFVVLFAGAFVVAFVAGALAFMASFGGPGSVAFFFVAMIGPRQGLSLNRAGADCGRDYHDRTDGSNGRSGDYRPDCQNRRDGYKIIRCP